jgi:hypothetical protein
MVEAYRELIDKGLERRASFVKPELPLHLRSRSEIMRHYIGELSTELEQFLP